MCVCVCVCVKRFLTYFMLVTRVFEQFPKLFFIFFPCGEMEIVVGKAHGNASSNPIRV